MSILGTFGKFFSGLAAHHQDAAQEVLKEVSGYLSFALTCVTAVDHVLKTEAGAPALASLEKFLSAYEPDLQKVQIVAQSLAALPANDRWREAALFALRTLVPPTSPLSLLNLAVEMAYNIHKASVALPLPAGA